jgi:hypothetical protein
LEDEFVKKKKEEEEKARIYMNTCALKRFFS